MVLLSVATYVGSDYALYKGSLMGFFFGLTASISLAITAAIYLVMLAMTVHVVDIWLVALALTGLFRSWFRYWPALIGEFLDS